MEAGQTQMPDLRSEEDYFQWQLADKLQRRIDRREVS